MVGVVSMCVVGRRKTAYGKTEHLTDLLLIRLKVFERLTSDLI